MLTQTSLHPYLQAQLAASQVSHAYLFSGQVAVEQAAAFAAALLCQAPNEMGAACGSCPACANLRANTHPDCRYIYPKDGLHHVAQMRELVSQASLSAVTGQKKVFILADADKMTEDAANTLLKLLEEPAPETVFILLSATPDAFLATILSRCQIFFFGNDAQAQEPQLPEDLLAAAESMLNELPEMSLYQVLLSARKYEKERDLQRLFFFALLQRIHRAVRGEASIAMSENALLRSANMLEMAIDLIGRSINQKMLADVVYLRLWQNAQA